MGNEAPPENKLPVEAIKEYMLRLEGQLPLLRRGIHNIGENQVYVQIIEKPEDGGNSIIQVLIQKSNGYEAFLDDFISIHGRLIPSGSGTCTEANLTDVQLCNNQTSEKELLFRREHTENIGDEGMVDDNLLTPDEARSILEIITAFLESQQHEDAVREGEVVARKAAILKRVRRILEPNPEPTSA